MPSAYDAIPVPPSSTVTSPAVSPLRYTRKSRLCSGAFAFKKISFAPPRSTLSTSFSTALMLNFSSMAFSQPSFVTFILLFIAPDAVILTVLPSTISIFASPYVTVASLKSSASYWPPLRLTSIVVSTEVSTPSFMVALVLLSLSAVFS